MEYGQFTRVTAYYVLRKYVSGLAVDMLDEAEEDGYSSHESQAGMITVRHADGLFAMSFRKTGI